MRRIVWNLIRIAGAYVGICGLLLALFLLELPERTREWWYVRQAARGFRR